MALLDRHRVYLYQNYLLYGIAFLIPLFPKMVPLLIVLFGLLSVFAIAKGYSRVNMGEISVLMLIFFALHLVGLTYTENLARGWFDIEVKLSLMAFPVAFIGFRFMRTTTYLRTLRMFLYGTVAASIFCVANSSYKFFVLDYPYYHFITTRFSVIVHPSYFALYLIFSILILTQLEWPLVSKSPRRTLVNVLTLVFLSLVVILTGSKTGFIMWVCIALLITALFVRESRIKWLPILALVAIMSVVGVILQQAPLLRSRIVNVLKVVQSDELNPNAKESTALRALVYKSAFELVGSQDWYGQGSGDFQDELDKVYERKGYVQAAERHLNAHNLFLQSWISLGIPGLVMVAGIFMLLITVAWRNKDPIMQGFTILVLIISITESTFNVQAGVVFFSFFAVLTSRRASMENAVKSGA